MNRVRKAVPLLVGVGGSLAHAVGPTKMTDEQEKLLSGFTSSSSTATTPDQDVYTAAIAVPSK